MMEKRWKTNDFILLISFYILTITVSRAAVRNIYQLETIKEGSLEGGTNIYIDGSGFAANNYEGGNTVKLVSDIAEYDCEVSKDGTIETRIQCVTVPMPHDEYFVRVKVDGEDIPLDFYCGGNPFHSSCRFIPKESNTPTITHLFPTTQSTLPGNVIELCGKIFSGLYGSHISPAQSTNGVTEQILRVYAGYQPCELVKAGSIQSELHGITLDNDGTSLNGCMKCQMTGTFIGNSNASFIIDGKYGRSWTDLDMLRVAANDDLYMIQTFAEVTGVSPHDGSTEGGLELMVSGKYFDTDVEVQIGGTECEVIGEVTPDQFKCRTAKRLTTWPAYPGGRGTTLEMWTQTTSTYANLETTFTTLTESASDYVIEPIDEFRMESTSENFVARMRGFFVPSHTGEYTFRVTGDKGKLFVNTGTSDTTNPASKVEVVANPTKTTSGFKESSRYMLTADKVYYMEAIFQTDTGGASFKVATKFFNNELFIDTDTGFAIQERQKFKFDSVIVREQQTITITGFNNVTHTNEVQSVRVVEDSAAFSDAKYQLVIFGVSTEPMTSQADATEIQNKLNSLPFLHSSESFSVTATPLSSPDGADLVITFNSERGELGAFTYNEIPGSNGETLTVTVARTTPGVPSGHYLALTHQDMTKPSQLISPIATAGQVQEALSAMYGTRCSSMFINPVGRNKFYNYESSKPDFTSGTLTNEVEPFCGKKVIKKPSYLYRHVDDTTNGLMLTTSVFLLCFAYRGGEIQDFVQFKYNYLNDNNEIIGVQFNYPVTFETMEDKWFYYCVDMRSALQARHSTIQVTALQFYIKHIRVFKLGSVDANYIDDVMIGRKAPIPMENLDTVNDYRMTPVKPNGALIESVSVQSSSVGVYDVTLVPHDCGNNFPPLVAVTPLVTGGAVTVTVTAEASPPLSGTFDVTFGTQTFTDLSYEITADDLASELEMFQDIGNLAVTRSGDCADFYFIIKFLSWRGDAPEFVVDGTNIAGDGVSVTVQTLDHGGLMYDPIPGDLSRTFHLEPQATVIVNEVPSLCTGDCTIRWSTPQTPTITGSTPVLGYPGTDITISGTGFDPVPENNVVMTGIIPCTPTTSASDGTQIVCTTGQGPRGVTFVYVWVKGKGKALNTAVFVFNGAANNYSPHTTALGGGIIMTVNGEGLAEDVRVTINGVTCDVVDSTTQVIHCILPAMAAGNYEVHIITNSVTLQMTDLMTYDAAITPTISSVTPTTEGVAGGSPLQITGTGFGTTGTLRIGDTEVEAVFTDTLITATLPPMAPGMHKVWVFSGSDGAAVNSMYEVPTINYILIIDNVFPLSGSMAGGTKVTLTGQGFSTDADKTKVMIGEFDCDIETPPTTTEVICTIESTSNIVEITNQGVNKVFGKGYAWDPKTATPKIGDTVRWTWTTYPYILSFSPRVMQVVNATTVVRTDDGFISAASPNGMFEYQIGEAGTYYFSSDWIDTYETIEYTGILYVQPMAAADQMVGEVKLIVADQEATHDLASGVGNPTPPSGCGEETSAITGCTMADPTGGASDKFNFLFKSCRTPTVSSFSINEGTTDDTLVIIGTGFSTTECQNIVMIGDDLCTVTPGTATANQISCTLNAADEPEIGQPQPIKVSVVNRGTALITVAGQNARLFETKPMLSDISSTMLSLNGQSKLTITGSGFQGDETNIVVTIGSLDCPIVSGSVTYTSIMCTSPQMSAGQKLLEVKVSANGQLTSAVCKNNVHSCMVNYDHTNTPAFSAVSPTTLDGSSTSVTIDGSGFGTDMSKIEVEIGGEDCAVSSVTDTQIQCTVTNIPVGTQAITILRQDKGFATNTNSIQITSSAVVSAISPSSGSTHGGTILEISGNGFTDDTTVTIGGQPCAVSEVTLSMVKCTTASHAAQNGVALSITANSVTYPAQTFDYTLAATPSISSVTFNPQVAGQTMYINGAGFSTTTVDNTVTVGMVDCPITTTPTAVQIQCTAPVVPLGTHNVKVYVKDKGFSNEQQVTYTLSLTSINPSSGSSGGGQVVTLTGSGFDDSVTATICDVQCVRDEMATQTADTLICLTPKPSGTVSGNLDCNVKVSYGSEESILTDGFTYRSDLTPTITSVTPASSGTGGGVLVTIDGTLFSTVPSQVSVKIGGTPCNVQSSTVSQITCRTGEHPLTEETMVVVEIGSDGMSIEDSAGASSFQYVDKWGSPYTWGGGDPPGDGSLVIIQEGQTVILDQDTANLKAVIIQGGKLIFDPTKDVELIADNILILNGGSLQIGTEEEPYTRQAKITCKAHPRTKELPIYGTCSIGVRNGTLDMHGEKLDKTWTRLAQTAAAGSNQIVVMDSVTTGTRPWRQGDQIAIATTGGRDSQEQTEVHTIASVANDGVTITLDDPLAFEHLGVTETIAGHTFEFRAEVGHLTRNIKLQGTSDPQWEEVIEKCDKDFKFGQFDTQSCFLGRFGEEMGTDQFGIQTIIHPQDKDSQEAVSRIEYTEFNHAGQAFRLGRYPMHFHLMGDASMSYIKGCALHKTFNRAVNVHDSHNVTVCDNVIYNVMGGAYFLEDGIERRNTFCRNLALFVRSSSSLLNDDLVAAAFWATNPDNDYFDNAVAGGTHFGWWYRLNPTPTGPSTTDDVNPEHGIMGIFDGNSVHSCGWFGLWVFQKFMPRDNGLSSGSPTQAVFKNLYVWNCEKGAEFVEVGGVQFENFNLINNEIGIQYSDVQEGPYFESSGALIKNGVIVGSSSHLPALSKYSGVNLPMSQRLLIDGTEFHRYNGANVMFDYTFITGTNGPNNGGFSVHTQNLVKSDVGTNNCGKFDHQFHGIVQDNDGSLIGDNSKAGWRIVTSNVLLPSTCIDFPCFSQSTPAKICPPEERFHRVSLNEIKPESLEFKDIILENAAGNTVNTVWERKRKTHPKGWMFYLPSKQIYKWRFENAEQMTNISFDVRFDLFEPTDWLGFDFRVAQKPDCVETNGNCIEELSGPLTTGEVPKHGDWYYVTNSMSVVYFVSTVSQPTTSISRKKRQSPMMTPEISMAFQMFKCQYPNCEPPPDPNNVPPEDLRPDHAKMWSVEATWPNSTKPVAGECLTIAEGEWIVVDEAIPPLCELILYGTIEFEANDGQGGFRSFELRTPHIVIMGTGRLIAGFNDNQPFLGNLHIILQGSHSSTPYILQPDDRDLGVKTISVFGGLDLNGRKIDTVWTTLKTTADVGDSSLTVAGELDWAADSEIVVTPTGYSAWETETFKISGISAAGGQTVITLNDTLNFKHLVHSETIDGKDFTVKAEVGLLTRNIKIEGEDYNGLFSESFGASVQVSASSSGTGYARLSNVEFYHTGQEGYIESYDARYSLVFADHGPVSSGRPSYVKSLSFHNGFSPAIGLYNSHNIPVMDNVIHGTVYWAIQTNSIGSQLKRNLIVLSQWQGSYMDRLETSNFDHQGMISAMEATDLVLEGNALSGGERACYHVPPQSCDPGATGLYSDNIARTCLLGVMVKPEDSLSGDCARFTGFSVSKCPYYGIYYQNAPSLKIHDVTIADSAVGILPFILGPPSAGHTFEEKFVSIADSLIIGKSAAYDCTTDVLDMNDDNVRLAINSRPSEVNRRIGMMFGQFTSGGNKFPEKKSNIIMSYQAIKGITTVDGVTFAGFNNDCNLNGSAIATNDVNDDGQHPVEVMNSSFEPSNDVDPDHIVFFHRPRLSVIDISNCVDMDCDGMKKSLIKDLDGSILGIPGGIIPDSGFEWDGDPQRGLGDYRIPKSMLTTLSGVRINPAQFKGIIRNESCIWHDSWQAYECKGLNYEMLVIESMDEDTETRRISPVAIVGHDQQGIDYVDLINGPQDHGWCAGYTCLKRLSTFQALVIPGRPYTMHFTGTTPQNMRYFLINTEDTEAIVLGVFYPQPYRLDVFHNGQFVMPKNGEEKIINGKKIYSLKPEYSINQYVPVPTDPAGANWFDGDENMLYFVIRGPLAIEIKTQESIIISIYYPPFTVDEFYGEKVVEYIASFFDIPPEKVRLVNIVSADDSTKKKRRKRSTDYDVLVIEVGDEPTQELNGTVDNPLTWEELQQILSQFVNEGMLGNFSVIVNGTVVGVSVAPPISPNDTIWATLTATYDGSPIGYRILVAVDHLEIYQPIVPSHEGVPFTRQPKIKVFDTYGNSITELGTPDYPWFVTASLRGGNPAAELLGNTTVQFEDGWANFTNLGINYFGSGYIIDFNISSPQQGENFSVSSQELNIPARQIHAAIVETPITIVEQTVMSITVELRDTVTGMKVEKIDWRSHVWNIEAMLRKVELSTGSLVGTKQQSFDTMTSQALFTDLEFSSYGQYVVSYHVTSVPADYDFYIQHKLTARGQHHVSSTEMNETAEIKLKFGQSYPDVVGNEGDYIAAYLGDWYSHGYPDIEVLTSNVSPGSIILTLTINGSSYTINETLHDTCDIITNGTTGLTFNGHTLTLTPYMTYDGNTFYGVECAKKDTDDDDGKDFTLAIIIACSLIGVTLLIIVVFCLLWKCKVIPKTKTADMQKSWRDVDDILFREKSFMSITSNKNAPLATNMAYNGFYRKEGMISPHDSLQF